MMYTSGTTGAPKGVIRPLLPADWRGTPPFAADLIALFGVGGSDVRGADAPLRDPRRAPCTPPLKRAMIDWWGPILLEYCSGSEGVGLTMIDAAEVIAHPVSVGRARKGTLHIVDDAGRELAPGRTGRVCFSGVAPFAYHNAPEKTAARSHAGGLQTFGDLGRVDEQGYLDPTDRLDDMTISGGVNLYPQEMEAAIRMAPGVWDCAVVGVADPDFGERPVAFVVPSRGTPTTALAQAVRGLCEARLGRYKQPREIHVVEELPRSPTGKLLRRALRDRLQTAQPANPVPAQTPTEDPG